MTRDEMIKKVQGCLALTGSTNENEAQAALAMVQKLLAKYHLAMADVTDGVGEAKEEPVEQKWCYEVSGMRPWVRVLTQVVAKNFRCKAAFAAEGKHYPCFVGYQTDAAVAVDVLTAAVKYCDRKGENIAQTFNDKGYSSRVSSRTSARASLPDSRPCTLSRSLATARWR